MNEKQPADTSRIMQNPETMAGTPVVKGTRIPVERVIAHLAHNPDLNDLFAAYPELTVEDVKACLSYAHAAVARRPSHPAHKQADRPMQPAYEGGPAPARTPSQGWEQEAEHFAAWARTPGHDAYWYYSSAFFDFLPPPGKATLEIGCGEGRVCRDLAARGHRVTGVDAAPTLVRLAQEADPTRMYIVADAAALPFEAAAFDLAVAYNSLMDIEDMPGAVREVARVLEPGGHFCVCLTHPMVDAGTFATEEADAPFVIAGSYLTRRWLEKTVERDGLQMTFRSWAYPLEGYARALEAAGFLIEAICEPAATSSAMVARPRYARWQRLPMFLHLRAVRP